MEETVLFAQEGPIAIITLNRPERRNAINRDLLINLYSSIERISGDDSIRVGVITGNGKSFCSGIDLKVVKTQNLFNLRGDGTDFPDIICSCKKPLIAAVNGHAITGGFEIALNCDFIVASEHASFADTHARVDIHPGWGMTQLLQQAVGVRMAKQMSLTCQFVSAEEALRIGLVNEVVPHERLMERARELAANIAEGRPGMLARVKELIEFRTNMIHDEGYKNERRGFMKFMKENLPASS